MLKGIIALIVGILLAIGGIVLSEGEPDIAYNWTAPVDGEPVVFYRAEIDLSGEYSLESPVYGESFAMPWPNGGTIRVRVAGVDAQGRQGGWSGWSVLFTDLGAPGVPGVPILAN